MHYINKNGLKVATEGTVIIDGEEHLVLNGFVACNASLNHRAWNVTEKRFECLTCALMKPKGEQLKLF